MAHKFTFPDVGEGIKEGKIVKWMVNEGDQVDSDQSIVEIETDKAVVEIPAPEPGYILKRYGEEGSTINVGDVLVIIGEKGESPEKAEKLPLPQEKQPEKDSTGVVGEVPEHVAEVTIPKVEKVQQASQIMATPAVRALAKELGVDVMLVEATGLGGRITEQDVQDAVKKQVSQQTTPQEAAKPLVTQKPSQQPTAQKTATKIRPNHDFFGYIEYLPYKGMRKAIGEHMQKAWHSPMVTHMEKIDATELHKIREAEKGTIEKERGVKLTYLGFIIKACMLALKDHPYLNAVLDEENEEIIVKKYFNIGIAIDTGDGLVVPVIKAVQDKSIIQIAKEIIELAQKARDKKLDPMEMRGGTFTITNIGSIGGIYATPILNSPEVAILGVMRMSDEPMAINGRTKIRKTMNLVLTFDHRVVDGAEAARFMNTLKKHLEDRELLLLELK